MAKKPAMGRGLDALLGATPGAQPRRRQDAQVGANTPSGEVVGHMAGTISLLDISLIDANPDQPRTAFEEEALAQLTQSIGELGIIQPITVHKIRANRYEIISGERRFRAAQRLGMDAVPAYIREADDQTVLEMALVENIQRQDLHAIEVALSFNRLIEECGMTQAELGKRVGKNRTTVTNYLRLLKLPAEIQTAVSERDLTMGHARALTGIDDPEWQMEVFRSVIDDKLSVRETEHLSTLNGWSEEPTVPEAPPAKKKAKVPMSFNEQNAADELNRRFGKIARLKATGNGDGRIELRYDSPEALDKLLAMLNL